ncbi:MAG TPA: 4Fe-4S binding protein, partial [Bacteroidetes bacterium]|nr:4Fe-4S binding protein [Bacteroidota bacterium]
MMKYRHNRYQLIRTLSVTFFQLVLAWIIPAFLVKMQGEKFPVSEHYFSYFWPLGYNNLMPDFLAGWTFDAPAFTKFVIAWSVVMSFIAVPVLTYYFGKRWYCSWVCGCGGLAETAGDSFRHLSDKSVKAWRFERVSIYSVLVLITLVTATLLLDWKFHFLGDAKGPLKEGYGFIIGSIFAGVVGTGFYPILGSRVWCRFGCPQAAILGILQKYFSRFRITTNGAQCISCGNCSTHCEMGIDVKSYAQRGENIVRASCVGCGVCSAVCPRGVLNLENGPTENRMNGLNPISFDADEIKVKM